MPSVILENLNKRTKEKSVDWSKEKNSIYRAIAYGIITLGLYFVFMLLGVITYSNETISFYMVNLGILSLLLFALFIIWFYFAIPYFIGKARIKYDSQIFLYIAIIVSLIGYGLLVGYLFYSIGKGEEDKKNKKPKEKNNEKPKKKKSLKEILYDLI